MSAPLGFARRIGRAVTTGATGAMFGLYAAAVVGVLALASTGAPVAMAIAGLLLAACVAALVWWSGAPPAPAAGEDRPSERLS